MILKIKPTDNFDARKGFHRWILPGMSIYYENLGAQADLWIHKSGDLLVRFSSSDYICSYKIKKSDKTKLSADDEDIVTDFIEAALNQWLSEGVDNDVHECIDIENILEED